MQKIAISCFFMIGLFVYIFTSQASAKFDPAFIWTTIDTQHFSIHYHQGEEELAMRAAAMAEEAHARLVPRITWKPEGKTHLVLADATDYGGGMTAVVPYRNIIILITPPRGVIGNRYPGDPEAWLRAAITHEYTHALQLDMVSGFPETLQSIFGRFYFPNMLQPAWMMEGLADYELNEYLLGGDRPSRDMILRMAALEGPFLSLDQATTYALDSWPGFQTPYLFGESFTRYLADTYGRDALAEVSTTYSGRGVPFLVNSTGMRVLHRPYEDLWTDWQNALKDRYGKQQEETASRGVTASVPLTRKGYLTVSPSFSPDGALIAYSSANAEEYSGIHVMNADGSGDRKLVENVFLDGSLSWSPDGKRLYYTKLEAWRNTNSYNDIYCYDFRRNREIRLTKGLRARDPHISPDGKRLVFVVNKPGMTSLAAADVPLDDRMALDRQGITSLTDESRNQYATPRFSPDGSKIAVSVSQPDGNVDIWILDARGNKLGEISHDRAIDDAPAWSPDGRYIYFASDRTGISNLYAYELETKTSYGITNVLGGAFMPCPSPDGKTLAFSSYSSGGFDIHALAADPDSWKPAEPCRDPYPALRAEEKPVEITTRPYSPLSTIYPRYWIPWFGTSSESGTMLGAFTFGQDVLRRHQYYVTGLYGPKSGRIWYTLDYLYDGLYPTLRLQASDTDVTYADLLADTAGRKDYVERASTYDLSVIVPFVKVTTQHALTFGYRWTKSSHLTELPPWPAYNGPIPAEGALASGRITYVFNSSRRYGYSVSPEQGRTIALGYERFDGSLGSDFDINKYIADWHEYINVPGEHHVLLVRAFAGTSSGEVIPQGAFQLGGDFPGDITLSTDAQAVYLRGYPQNAFRGQKAALASLEYRFPVKNIEHGWGIRPIFFERLHGAVFYEAGNAWDGAFHKSDLKRSVGAEVRLDMMLGYVLLPATLRVGIAVGLDEKGETIPTFGLSLPLEL